MEHENVLKVIGVCMCDHWPALILPWVENGNIREFMKAHPSDQDQKNHWVCTMCLTKTTNWLSVASSSSTWSKLPPRTRYFPRKPSRGMCLSFPTHSPLTDANMYIIKCNVLIHSDGRALLTDPNLSVTSGRSLCQGRRGGEWVVQQWKSPEQIWKGRYPTKKGDIYSFGMLCYEVRRSSYSSSYARFIVTHHHYRYMRKRILSRRLRCSWRSLGSVRKSSTGCAPSNHLHQRRWTKISLL